MIDRKLITVIRDTDPADVLARNTSVKYEDLKCVGLASEFLDNRRFIPGSGRWDELALEALNNQVRMGRRRRKRVRKVIKHVCQYAEGDA